MYVLKLIFCQPRVVSLCVLGNYQLNSRNALFIFSSFLSAANALYTCSIFLTLTVVCLFKAFCDYWRFGTGGHQENVNAVCILALNIINDKVREVHHGASGGLLIKSLV